MASDSPDQNLTQYFSLCNDFIHAARLRDGNVLIHWWVYYEYNNTITKFNFILFTTGSSSGLTNTIVIIKINVPIYKEQWWSTKKYKTRALLLITNIEIITNTADDIEII